MTRTIAISRMSVGSERQRCEPTAATRNRAANVAGTPIAQNLVAASERFQSGDSILISASE